MRESKIVIISIIGLFIGLSMVPASSIDIDTGYVDVIEGYEEYQQHPYQRLQDYLLYDTSYSYADLFDMHHRFDERHYQEISTSNSAVPQSIRKQSMEKPDFDNGTTWYVDDDGGKDFIRIQDAINASSDGDTVFVYNGFYNENLMVSKPLILQGEDRDTTIIVNDHGVIVDAYWVTIKGFTITSGVANCIYLISSSYNTITGNILRDTYCGIRLVSSANNTITGNILIDNRDGIYLAESNNIIIKDNEFHSNGIIINGINLESWNSHSIVNNRANDQMIRYYKNTKDIVVPSDTAQVILANCTGFTIQNLALSDFNIGIQLGFSARNMILENTITFNKGNGISLYFSSSNIISQNNITSKEGLGIILENSSDNMISENSITSDNFFIGMILATSSDNSITGNIITGGNASFGILLAETVNNLVSRNHINSEVGLFIISSTYSTIKENNFMGHRQAQANQFDSYSNTWSANYWNDWPSPIPRPIIATLYLPRLERDIPWLNVDWHPALKPYEIG